MNNSSSKKNLAIFFSILLLIFSSCSRKTEDKQVFTFHPKINVVNKQVKFNDVVEDYKYIKLETNENCLIGKINQVLIYKEKIFILTEEIYCFNMDGKFLYSINKKGKGPTEFIRIYNFSIDKDMIYLNSPRKIVCYDCNTGEFVKYYNLNIGARKLGVVGNNLYIDVLLIKSQTNKGRIFISNIDNQNSIKALFHEKKYELSVQNQFIGFNNNFYFIDPFLNQVYKIYDEKVESYIFFDFGDKNPTEAENATRLANRSLIKNFSSKARQLENVYETPDFIMANIIVGSDGLVILYDKKSEKSITWTYKSFICEPYQIFIAEPHAVSEDYFCSVLSAVNYNKQTVKNSVIPEPSNPEFKKYSLMMNTDSQDNPIIALYKFKKLK